MTTPLTRTARIHLRLRQHEYDELMRQAKKARLPIVEYVRTLLLRAAQHAGARGDK